MPKYATADQPEDVILADVNGDGRLDVVTANFSGTISVLLGDGKGRFQPRTDFAAGAGAFAVAAADLNGDGRLDVVTANKSAGTLSVLLGSGNGTFAAPVAYATSGNPNDVAIGDINKDGILDLVSVSFNSSSASLFLGQAGGLFAPAVAIAASPSSNALALGDLDNDGDLDIAMAGDFRTRAINGSLEYAVTILTNSGNGTFAAPSYIRDFAPSSDIGIVDWHINGVLDIVSVGGSLDRGVRVHRGGTGPGYSTVIGQVDVSIEDAVFGNGALLAVHGFSSSAQGTFQGGIIEVGSTATGVPQPPRYTTTGGHPTDIAKGDLNGDGLVDAVISYRDSDGVDVVLRGRSVVSPVLATGEFGAGPSGGGWTNDDLFPRRYGDVNGDGRADLVAFGEYGVTVALGRGDGTFAPGTGEIRAFGHDPNHGGLTDANRYPRELADVNGDGLDDIVGFGDTGVYVALATGNGHFGNPFKASAEFGAANLPNAGWIDQERYPRRLGDVNGDGMADIVGFGEHGVYVALATGGGFFGAATFEQAQFNHGSSNGWQSNDLTPRLLADVNGDGRDDIVAFGQSVYVSFADAGGHFPSNGTVSSNLDDFNASHGWTGDHVYPRMAADMNGDGFADIVGFGEDGVVLALGHGDGRFDHARADAAIFAHAPNSGGLTDDNIYPRAIADVDGDGLMDLLAVGDAGVYIAQGTLFF